MNVPAMYCLEAAQPRMMVPPSNARRRLDSVSPSSDKGLVDIQGVLVEAEGQKSSSCWRGAATSPDMGEQSARCGQ